MRRLLFPTVLLATSVLAGCGYGPGYGNSDQPMMSTGAPCGFRAVDAGICPKVGYRVPPGESY
ncbi:hypothetical protein [Mesorhizobium sp. YM1C-6-2]|uniref:hypothetical protein n=1 Tax=Mesorhizobium sp. YM1C-6-2 TaxID=1827501 RepID=UPI000EF292CF|nr:hypothetical protein [Mesorhizobium sp. YM1C-6-2]RLP22352.1 hypothetical protein D8676_25075 [Mesorhizobium sp. YM1C-6-2]